MDQILQTLIAGILSFLVIALIFFFLCLLCNRNPSDSRTRDPASRPGLNSDLESASFDPSLCEISMLELVEATNGFDPKLIIGDGSFGLVYKAKLYNGVTVAVKKLSHDAFQGLREFRAEMETLGKLRHRNIVKILGYCVSGYDRVLIYEFIEKGSLDQWLQDTSSVYEDEVVRWPLPWVVRVKIVKGVANGLGFMHGLDTPIVHRDIKASNVLLDGGFEAHIADFGLARTIEGAHSHLSTQAAGTMGYMPPEYLSGFTAATVRADVYSFGVLIFEVVTGKRPNCSVMKDGREMLMVEWVKKMISENKHLEVVDPSIPNPRDGLEENEDGLKENEVCELLRIANLCTNENPKERPLMCDIVEMLNQIAV